MSKIYGIERRKMNHQQAQEMQIEDAKRIIMVGIPTLRYYRQYGDDPRAVSILSEIETAFLCLQIWTDDGPYEFVRQQGLSLIRRSAIIDDFADVSPEVVDHLNRIWRTEWPSIMPLTSSAR